MAVMFPLEISKHIQSHVQVSYDAVQCPEETCSNELALVAPPRHPFQQLLLKLMSNALRCAKQSPFGMFYNNGKQDTGEHVERRIKNRRAQQLSKHKPY